MNSIFLVVRTEPYEEYAPDVTTAVMAFPTRDVADVFVALCHTAYREHRQARTGKRPLLQNLRRLDPTAPGTGICEYLVVEVPFALHPDQWLERQEGSRW